MYKLTFIYSLDTLWYAVRNLDVTWFFISSISTGLRTCILGGGRNSPRPHTSTHFVDHFSQMLLTKSSEASAKNFTCCISYKSIFIVLYWFEDIKWLIFSQKIFLYSSKGGLATTATYSQNGPWLELVVPLCQDKKWILANSNMRRAMLGYMAHLITSGNIQVDSNIRNIILYSL